MNKKFVLVLGGGGAKGIYQLGCWKALIEERIDIIGAFGTSIGSINGAFVVQNEFNLAYDFWMNINYDSVINIPSDLIKDGKFCISLENFNSLLKFQKEIAKNGGVDNTPLKNLLSKYINSEKIFISKKDFGLLTFSISSLNPIELFKEDMIKSNFFNYLLASSSLPGLKPVKIGDEVTIDGGVYDNIPFHIAKKRGYRNIIVLDVKGVGVNRMPDVDNTNTIYIQTNYDLGSIIEVDKNIYLRNYKLGYNETKKMFGHYLGYKFTFRNYKVNNRINEYLRSNYKTIFHELNIKKNNFEEILPTSLKFIKDYYLVLIENTMELFKMNEVEIYDFSKIQNEINLKYFEMKKNKNNFETYIEKIFHLFDDKIILSKVLFYLIEKKIT